MNLGEWEALSVECEGCYINTLAAAWPRRQRSAALADIFYKNGQNGASEGAAEALWVSPDSVWVAGSGAPRDGDAGPLPVPPPVRGDAAGFCSFASKKVEIGAAGAIRRKATVNKRAEESARACTGAPHGDAATLKKQLIPDSVKHERQREAVNIKRRRSRSDAFRACL